MNHPSNHSIKLSAQETGDKTPDSQSPFAGFKRIGNALQNAFNARFLPFWEARAPRERQILSIGSILLLLMLLYVFVWEPAQAQRIRLEKNLPELRSQLSEMQSLAQEARGLSATRSNTLHGTALQDALQASLAKKGLKTTKLNVLSGSGERAGDTVQMQLSAVNFGQWADWLDDIRRQQQLNVIDAQIQYVGAPALVNIQATLQGSAQ